MDLPPEIDDYIKESIEYALGLPVSSHTLESKLRASEQALIHLRGQNLYLQSRLKEKDEAIERSRVCNPEVNFNYAHTFSFCMMIFCLFVWLIGFRLNRA